MKTTFRTKAQRSVTARARFVFQTNEAGWNHGIAPVPARGRAFCTFEGGKKMEIIAKDGMNGFDAAEQAGLKKEALVMRVNGEVKELWQPLHEGDKVEVLTFADEDGRKAFRHTASHVLAEAIAHVRPGTKYAIGPAIADGFYYDVDSDEPFTADDLKALEKEMQHLIKKNERVERFELPRAEALKLMQDRSEPYKVELINDLPDDAVISFYTNGDFTDLCAGPHLASTGKIKAVKLTQVAGAYWRGDEKNKMLQRIYGTCFPNRTQLDEHLERLEEARRRDHRKLGRELGLFCIDESVGQGLILWKPKGALIRRSLQDFITEELDKLGYSQVYTPNIGKLDLYRTSGHFPYYQESQYAPIPERDAMEKLSQEGASCAELFNGLATGTIEGYMLKPMNCPHHIKIYANDAHSYRDLPVRLAEFGTVYRWEQSGELGGMTRVRGFTQDDAHIFCTPDQLAGEIRQCLGIVKTIFGTLGMTDYRVRLSMRDPESDKYVGSPENWDKAEQALREAAEWLGADYSEEAGEAAFYGPKIDFIVRDAIGREWQLGTVQVDYNLPERFDLHYTGADNKPHRPVMVHRAPFGSMERFTGLLIEHFEGKFPTWLSPEQVRVLPISDKVTDVAAAHRTALAARGVRVTVDETPDKIGAKIRNARLDRVPYMLVLGQREAEDGTVSVRHRDKGDLGAMPFEQFADLVAREIAERHISPVI